MTKSTHSTPAPERKLVLLDTTIRGAAEQADRAHFKSRVIGQDEAVKAALDAVARARNPLRDPDRPIAVIYELGPSRTGKTLIAETLAELLHGDKECMVKINGGNYKQRHEVARLIGAPPGYLGHKSGDGTDSQGRPGAKEDVDTHAKLTRKNLVASRGKSKTEVTIVLLDEANLMHADFDDVLMAIFDKGQLDMGNNLVTDFRDCIIILTSNIGMDEVKRKTRRKMGFNQSLEPAAITHEDVETTVKAALEERYRPEWLNRIDQFVIFRQLEGVQLFAIVDVELEKFYQRMERRLPRGQMFHLEVDETAKKFLLASALADNGNIAQLKRKIQLYLIDPIGNLLTRNHIGNGDVLVVRHEADASALSFYTVEGEQRSINADKLDDVLDTPESQSWLASTRRLNREQGSAVAPVDFDVLLTARNEESMIRKAGLFLKELKDIYSVEILRHSYAKVAPWTCILTVRATYGQIEEFRKRNTDVTVREVSRTAQA